MKSKWFLFVAGFAACGAGCGPLALTARTVVIEPSEYCTSLSSFKEHLRDHRLAEAAWKDTSGGHPEHTWSRDYAGGFIEGFEDYLYAGGNGEPPPVPPRSYWKPKYETPEGRQAIEDWFAGFRHGAIEARLSGHRQLIVVPASSPPLSAARRRFNPIISGPPRDFGAPANPPAVSVPPGSVDSSSAPSERAPSDNGK